MSDLIIIVSGGRRKWMYYRPVGRNPYFWSKYQRDDRFQDTWVHPPGQWTTSASNTCLVGVPMAWATDDPYPLGGNGIFLPQLVWGYMGKRVKQTKSAFKRDPIWHPYLKIESRATINAGVTVNWTDSAGNRLTTTGINDDTFVASQLPSYIVEDHDGGKAIVLDLGIVASAKQKLYEALRVQYSENFHDMVRKDQIVDLGSTIAELVMLKSSFKKGTEMLRPMQGVLAQLDPSNPRAAYNLLRVMSAKWLAISYGIKPLVSTMYDLITKLPESYKKGNLDVRVMRTKKLTNCKPVVLKVYSKAARNVRAMEEDPNHPGCGERLSIGSSGANYTLVTIDDEIVYESGDAGCEAASWSRTTVEVRQSAIYKANQDWSRLFFTLGLSDVRPALWEIIPFSFIVDWFYKVGQFLTAQDDLQGLEVTSGCLTTEYRYIVETSLGSNATARVLVRDVVQKNGSVFDSDKNFIYHDVVRELTPAPTISAGTMVSKPDARALNAFALLVVLMPALKKLTGVQNLHRFLPRSASKRFIAAFAILTGITVSTVDEITPPAPGGDT